ncbi:MAG: hypothetical protein LBE21_05395 [Pseudomonadales bacterium]|jgi:hypothetical protein|nr:hypothetical protein [Pseudomonadales bacterium]
MKLLRHCALLAFLCAGLYSPLQAHHNTQAEYGPFDSDFITIDGVITNIKWGNPHIAFTIEVTGGDLPAAEVGQSWQVNSHPVGTMIAYGFNEDEFKVGDKLHMLAWTHVRGIKHLWPRAIQVNDGPFKSNLRYTDMIDIADGTFEALHIEPAANLNGSDPIRAGSATVAKLKAQGMLDADGNMIWPLP